MKKIYNVIVTKGYAEYNIEAESREEALNIADEWYNERHFTNEEVTEEDIQITAMRELFS